MAQQEITPNYISVVDGLSSPQVTVTFQDSYGFLWIGTFDGLQKYDGYHFETFKNDNGDPSSIQNNSIWAILEDAEHNIWVSTEIGMSRYDRKTRKFTNYDFVKLFSVSSDIARCFNVFIDSRNQLWALSDLGLLSFDTENDTWKLVAYKPIDSETPKDIDGYLLALTEDGKGGLWTASSLTGMLYKSPKDTIFKQIPIKNPQGSPFDTASNTITDLFVDTNNIVWFTSRKGIYKYNPATTELKTIESYDYGPFEINNHWNKILLDPKGNVWIANNFRGLLKFDGISDTYHEVIIAGGQKIPGGGRDFSLTRFTIDRSGIFWFGTTSKGLLKYDPLKNPFELYAFNANMPSLSSNAVFGLKASKINPDILYVGLRGNGMDIFNVKEKTFRHVSFKAENDMYGGSVRSIGEKNDGTLLLGTWGDGLIELDKNLKEVKRFVYTPGSESGISDNRVRLIQRDSSGNFWIGTNSGLNYFNPKTEVFKKFKSTLTRTYDSKLVKKTDSLAISGNSIAEIKEVTDNQNLSQPFEVLKETLFLIESVGEGNTGNGMVDFGWLENKAHDTIWNSFKLDNSYYAGGDSKNRILINTIKLKPGEYTLHYKSDDSHSYGTWNAVEPDVTSLYGIRVIGIPDQKLLQIFEQDLPRADEKKSLSGNSITGLVVKENYVWVGTSSSGLNKIDLESNNVSSYVHDPENKNSLGSNNIRSLIEDKNGVLWIATAAGITRFDPDKNQFTSYSQKDGLPTNLIADILPGENGEMWISSESGLSRMIINESLSKVTFINYNSGDGLGGNSFVQNVCARTPDGKFWFGGEHGLNAVNKIKENNTPPNLVFSDVLISNKSIYAPDNISLLTTDLEDLKEINLKHNKNNLSFEFAALHYANPQKNQYAHKLKGYEDDWVYDNRNYASYTNLKPGEYEFIVRASNAYGVWNEEGKSLRIIISPPWWQTWWAYGSYVLLLILLIYSFDRIMRRRVILREREKAKEKELAQAKEIEKAYHELKATQKQLIQSEKMASLGELTAGIAHEIQNPLNFVNNFSEVSKELLDEMKLELDQGNNDEVKEIADDLIQNLDKIAHHGKRADSIVKGMLQHSRNSSGEKAPVDINLLADEYFRLAYHGLRAKDKSFNATMTTDFDESIGKIEIVGQDIGRVVLNLITNAFYAVSEKKNQLKKEQPEVPYEPTVVVSTKKTEDSVEVTVTDNGNGIPKNLVNKIFQPFFTTKPTGEGTGLGLSLSYDIIKTHGGNLSVDSEEGKGTVFTIELPVKTKKKKN
ncbi:sensor histidine kinase [Gaetbulibacter aestuarii]